MPTSPFTEEHEALRSTVRRMVTDRLGALAADAERGTDVHAEALAVSADLRGLPDALADVVVAEELGRLRSGGVLALLLDAALLMDVGVDGAPAAVARHGDLQVRDATATGSLPMVVGGVIATAVLVLDAGVVLDVTTGCDRRPVPGLHALRGGVVADVVVREAACEQVEVTEQALHRAELREAAAAVSGAWQTFHDAVAYARQRRAFGRPIGTFQVNRHAVAEMATLLTAAEALVHDTAWALDRRGPASADPAAARLVAGSTARRVADLCLQLHGGYGYTMDFDVQRAWRDARALAIGDTDRRGRVVVRQGAHP